jgi:multiple sugar transport system ATP-binding protein
MRASLNQMHERLGVTTVYVTHDQVEAMTLGDRVCVLRDGILQQVDTPQNLFDKPVNLFVAGFMGSPAMNFATAELIRDGDGAAVTFADLKLQIPESTFTDKPGLDQYIGKKIILGIRPSDFEDTASAGTNANGWATLSVKAEVTEELGSEINVLFLIDAPPVEHKDTVAAADTGDDEEAALPLVGDKSLWTARVNARSHVRPGQSIDLVLDTHNLHFFDTTSGLAIGHPANVGK